MKSNTILVTYRDGTVNEVDVNIEVTTRAYLNNPKAKQINTFVNETIKPEEGIANIEELEGVVKYDFKDPVNTNKKGEYNNTIIITYDDGSTDEVEIKINVKPISEKYTPDVTKEVTKNRKEIVLPEDLVNNKQELPEDTKYTYDKEIDFNKSGENNVKLIVSYSDDSTDEFDVKIIIRKDAESYEPEIGNTTIERKSEPKAEDFVVNKEELPDNTKYEFKEPLDTQTSGKKETTIIVTYEDGTTDEVTFEVTVKTDAERYSNQIKYEKEKTINKSDY